MKHLIGRFYFKKPCFIGIKLYSKKAVVIGNIVGTLLSLAVLVFIMSKIV